MISTQAKAALNEVLLQAAIRAERINAARTSEQRASDLAKRMDTQSVTHRVPSTVAMRPRDDRYAEPVHYRG